MPRQCREGGKARKQWIARAEEKMDGSKKSCNRFGKEDDA